MRGISRYYSFEFKFKQLNDLTKGILSTPRTLFKKKKKLLYVE